MTDTTEGPEKWVPDALDQQEAYLADRQGTLHRTMSSSPLDVDSDEDDRVWCGTCGKDLRALGVSFCPDVPVGRCGCPLFMILDGEHLPHE